MKPIISGSGIRGIFGKSLTVKNAAEFASAFGVLSGRGNIVIGRDTRKSGPAVEAAVSAGLMAVGCNPLHLGIVPTPTVQLEAMDDSVRGGISITSSHNPGEWNALKLIGSDGVFLRSKDRTRLMNILDEEVNWVDYRSVGVPSDCPGSIGRHIKTILDIPWIVSQGKRFKVVLDVTGGAAAEFAVELMKELGIDFVVINPFMTEEGDFPRVAEPNIDSLKQLSEAVIRERADIGFAFDPDGDRLALIDENGRIIGEDYTVALALDYVLASRPGNAVVNLSTSRLAEDAAERHGCRVFRSPVGEVNVVEEMEFRDALIGGEGNGGVIDRICHAGRDSGVAMSCAISFLRSNPGATIGYWVDSFPSYTMFKYKTPLTGKFDRVIEDFNREYGQADDIRDGLWYIREKGWMHIRPSGTEPVVRFIAENANRESIEKDFRSFRKVMEKLCVE